MATINGDELANELNGTDEADIINGNGGDDTIEGRDGDDTIDGGDGDDRINGGDGANIVHGGEGDDFLFSVFLAAAGSSLHGDDGNDVILAEISEGGASFFGGSGNDAIQVGGLFGVFFAPSTTNTMVLDAGDGDDTVFVGHGGQVIFDYPASHPAFVSLNQIDLGAGNDRIAIGNGNNSVTLGSGADVIQFGAELGLSNIGSSGGYTVITDFEVGIDRISQLSTIIPYWDGSSNPFATGELRLVQEGSDTFLQRVSGSDGITTFYQDVIRFVNVDASSLTAADLGGFDPGGAPLSGISLTGTEGDDTIYYTVFFPDSGLRGTNGPDVISALGGDDYVLGLAGDDIIYGGAGSDILVSGFGNDYVEGGDGNDYIDDLGGSDTILGGNGDDVISLSLRGPSSPVVHGGAENDSIRIIERGAVLDGQPVQTAHLHGEAGDDWFEFGNGASPEFWPQALITVDGGIGNDRIMIYGASELATVVLGEGADFIDLQRFRAGSTVSAIVTDFNVAEDYFVLTDADLYDGLTNAAGVTDLFASGHYRLMVSEGDTLLQIDRDGGGDNFKSILVLPEFDATTLTAAHFQYVMLDDNIGTMTPVVAYGRTIDGTANGETINGTDGDDTLYGLGGNDMIHGGRGFDNLHGGAGDDTYHVTKQSTLVFENAGEGTDTIVASSGFYLYANVENLTLVNGAGDAFGVGNELDNFIIGNNGSNLLIGGAGNDELQGRDGIDALFGEAGNDVLSGGRGIDYLVGGIGDDLLFGDEDADAVYGQEGNDRLYGGSTFHTDILVGGEGNDDLYGNSGLGDYDRMDGGAGHDTYYVDTGDDLTFEAVDGGTDWVFANVAGENNGVYLYANVENLVLQGTTAFGVGNQLDNLLYGSDSANWLLGGAGNDFLNGGAGNDVLFGEAGSDRFYFTPGTGGDVIGDFASGEDVIDLSAYGFADFDSLKGLFVQDFNVGAIVFGNGDVVVLHNVQMSELDAGDFLL